MSSSDLEMMARKAETRTDSQYGQSSQYLANSSGTAINIQGQHVRAHNSHDISTQRTIYPYRQPSSTNSSLAGALGPVHPRDPHRGTDDMRLLARNSDNYTPVLQGSSSVQPAPSSSSLQLQALPPPPFDNEFMHHSMFSDVMMNEQEAQRGIPQNLLSQSVLIQGIPAGQQTPSMHMAYAEPAAGFLLPEFMPGIQQPWGTSQGGGDMTATSPEFSVGFQPAGLLWSSGVGDGPEVDFLHIDERLASANIQPQLQWSTSAYGDSHQPLRGRNGYGFPQAGDFFSASQACSAQEMIGAVADLPPTQYENDAPMPPPTAYNQPQTIWQPRMEIGERQINSHLSAREGPQSQTTSEAHTTLAEKASQDAPQVKGIKDEEEVKDGAMTPRDATAGLGDAMHNQSNRYSRFARNETYRLHHNAEPPKSMNILTTSALERSKCGDAVLRADLKAEKEKLASVKTPTSIPPNASNRIRAEGSTAVIARVSSPVSPQSASTAARVPAATNTNISFMTEKHCYPVYLGEDWVPAKSSAQILADSAAEAARRASVSVSPQTPEVSMPLDNPGVQSQEKGKSPESDANETEIRSKALKERVLPQLRHDGHLASHVSGLGGTFSEAYDGRSYLPDDAEQDPNHLPPPPPGARSGDHPLLLPHKPHPLHIRGQKLHRIMEPPSSTASRLAVLANEKKTERDRAKRRVENERSDDLEVVLDEKPEDDEITEIEKKLEEEVTEKDRQGSGWGYVEGGSHGRYDKNGLVSEEEMKRRAEAAANAPSRLKLSTEKKVAPKLACGFCRQRKIACGPGTESHTCNQCEKRSLYCVFPTESRRGMRTKRRSRKTSLNEDILYFDDDSVQPLPSAGGRKGRGSGRGGRGRGTITLPRKRGRPNNEVQDATGGDDDVEMDEDEQVEVDTTQQLGTGTVPFNAELSPLEPPSQETYLHLPTLANGEADFAPGSTQLQQQGQPFVNEYANTFQFRNHT